MMDREIKHAPGVDAISALAMDMVRTPRALDDNTDVRLQCLELAVRCCANADDVPALAARFLAFTLGHTSGEGSADV